METIQHSILSDPTALTTQLVWREVESLKELISSEISRIDKSIKVAHDDAVRVPTTIQNAIQNLKELHDEKFQSITQRIDDRVVSIDKQFADEDTLTSSKFQGVDNQFNERDKRAELLLATSSKAVDAALAAAKQAVDKQNESFQLSINKSESATTKQIDTMQSTISGLTKAFDDKITDLKDRITRNEGSDIGKKESNQSSGAMWGYVVGGIGALLGIAGFIMAMLRINGKL